MSLWERRGNGTDHSFLHSPTFLEKIVFLCIAVVCGLLLVSCIGRFIFKRWQRKNQYRAHISRQPSFDEVNVPNFDTHYDGLGFLNYSFSYEVPDRTLKFTVISASRVKTVGGNTVDAYVTASLVEPIYKKKRKRRKKNLWKHEDTQSLAEAGSDSESEENELHDGFEECALSKGQAHPDALRRISEVQKSRVVFNTTEPLFSFNFSLHCSMRQAMTKWVLLELSDHDSRGRDRKIGGILVRLDQRSPSDFVSQVLEEHAELMPMCPVFEGLGHVCISICIQSRPKQPAKLLVHVPEARDVSLLAKHCHGEGEMFVNILLYSNKRLIRQRISQRISCQHTINPYFGASFILRMDDLKLKNASLKVRLVHMSPSLGMRRNLGKVVIGKRAVTIAGEHHFLDCLKYHNRTFSRWHELM